MIRIRELKMSYSHGDPFTIDAAFFERGKLTTIIGRNGCGKTTLLRAMAGFMPYSGNILIDGKECRDYRRKERAVKLSYLPQIVRSAGMDVKTLADHGRFPWHGNYRNLSDEDKRLVENALEVTKMAPYRDRSLAELSGGELRRAYLAMVIAQNEEMMLLDEPTTYMDIESQTLLFEIVRELLKRQVGIIMTCHHMEQSFSYSDQIVIMDNRAIRRSGTPADLAGDTQVLEEVFGASVKKTEDRELLYPDVLVKRG